MVQGQDDSASSLEERLSTPQGWALNLILTRWGQVMRVLDENRCARAVMQPLACDMLITIADLFCRFNEGGN